MAGAEICEKLRLLIGGGGGLLSQVSRLGSFPTTNGSFSTTTNRGEPVFPCHQVLSLELCATWHVPEGP